VSPASLVATSLYLDHRVAGDVSSHTGIHGQFMTPKKLRPLRELKRLRRLGDQVAPKKKFGQHSVDSVNSGSSYLWPVEKVLVASRTIVDIQVLAEAGHSSGSFNPRPGFIAVVDQSGIMSAVERLRASSRGLRNPAEQISQELTRYTFGTPVLGLIDQPGAMNPTADVIDEVDRALSGTSLSGKFIVLCHSVASPDAQASANAGRSDVVRVGSNHVRWSSWNESHELAVMTAGLAAVHVEVV